MAFAEIAFAKTMNRKYNLLGDENMSEDKPEVGDVWQSTRRYSQKIYITNVLGRVYCVTEQGVASSRYFSDFREGGTYKYIGKSKVNIQQLFEV